MNYLKYCNFKKGNICFFKTNEGVFDFLKVTRMTSFQTFIKHQL